jgi:hypothetical protein
MKKGQKSVSLWLLAASLALGGCVSSAPVKQASKEMKDALVSVGAAEADLKKSLLAEIDATSDQVARAVVARAVRARIEDAAVKNHESHGELVEISDAIEATAANMRDLVAQVKTIKVASDTKDEDLKKALADMLKKLQDDLDKVLADPTISLTAAEKTHIGSRKAELEKWKAKEFVGHNDLVTLLQLARTRAFVDQKLLTQLDVHIRALKQVHNTVDGWIQTDVNVDGADVAKLVESAAAAGGGK